MRHLRNTLLFFFVVGTSLFGFAQVDSTTITEEEVPAFVEPVFMFPQLQQQLQPSAYLYGYGAINSTALTNNFYKPFLQGGALDRELRGEVLGRTGNNNVIGGDLNVGIRYTGGTDSLFGKSIPGFRYHFGLADRLHFNTRFTKDLFELAFFGNRGFEGDTAQLADFSLQLLRYQAFTFGAYYRKGKSTFGLSFGVLKGERQQQIEVSDAKMYTPSFGTELTLDIDFLQNRTDTGNTGFDAFNGVGASTDLLYHYDSGKWGSILVEVNDLGFISWNSKSIEQSVDSFYRYDGFTINSFFDLSDSLFVRQLVDSTVDSYSLRTRSKAYTSILPATIHLAYGRQLTKYIDLVAGVKARVQANYVPYFYARGRMEVYDDMYASAQLGLGGYGILSVGLGYTVLIQDKIHLSLFSNNLEGLLSPSTAGGNSIGVGIRYLINWYDPDGSKNKTHR